MFESQVVAKMVISILAVSLVQFSATYTAHADAKTVAYVAAIAGAVGSYLLGLYQSSPLGGPPAVNK